MIDKLLTLISGNLLLVKKSIEQENKTLASTIEASNQKVIEAVTQVVTGLSAVSEAMETLAKQVKEKPAIEVNVPDVEIPEITIPEISAPVVNVTVPEIRIPEIKLPTINVPAPQVTVEPNITVTPTPVTFPKEMSVVGFSALLAKLEQLFARKPETQIQYSAKNPMPVAFIDRSGRQYDLIHLGSSRSTGGGATPSEITGADKVLRTIAFDVSASGVVIPAVSGRRIKVYAIKLITDAPVSVAFRDGATDLLEGMQDYLANAGYIDNIQPPAFLFATSAGNALHLAITGAGNVSGRISYWSDDRV
jgi:hypothetical protein